MSGQSYIVAGKYQTGAFYARQRGLSPDRVITRREQLLGLHDVTLIVVGRAADRMHLVDPVNVAVAGGCRVEYP